jgi:CheY-like chemotaxis protein
LTDHDASLAGRRCLVLEDQFLIALDIQNILEVAGATVTSVSDVDAALKLLTDENEFDLAIVDVKLGGTATSAEVTTRLVELGIPFVFLTGMRKDEVNAHYPDAPVVEKPYVAAALIEALHKVRVGR